MRETAYQARIITRLRDMFPGCFIQKNDPQQQQGVPDILILFNDKWSMLEFKRSSNSSRQPNQEYFVNQFNEMSFAAVICPENEEEVLYELTRVLAGHQTVS